MSDDDTEDTPPWEDEEYTEGDDEDESEPEAPEADEEDAEDEQDDEESVEDEDAAESDESDADGGESEDPDEIDLEDLEGLDEEPTRDQRVEDDDDNLWAPIYGHDGAKAVLSAALKSGDVHVLMIGPPGSGKSTFLLRLEDHVPGVVYRSGDALTAVKLKKTLKDDPPILLIDEIEALSAEAFEALAVPMEHGRVVHSTDRTEFDEDIDTQIIAACNYVEQIPPHIRSRFREIEFEAYDESEYHDVCAKMLPYEAEWIETEQQARKVARITAKVTGTSDPRDARDVAQLSESMGEAKQMAKALNDPNAEVEGVTELSVDEIAQAEGEVQSSRMKEMMVDDILSSAAADAAREEAAKAAEEPVEEDATPGGDADENAHPAPDVPAADPTTEVPGGEGVEGNGDDEAVGEQDGSDDVPTAEAVEEDVAAGIDSSL